MNWETGVVSPLHQPEWRDVPLKARMETRYQCGFGVDVDTNVAALAEYDYAEHTAAADGTKKPAKLLYLTVSTGMGGGMVVDGQLYRGMNGEHPEAGHQCVAYRTTSRQPVVCACGSTGCLEALVSGGGIRRLYGCPAEQLTPEQWEEVAWNLGQGLRNLATIYLPDLIVLGGGVTFGAGEKLLAPAVRVMRDHLKIVPHPHVYASRLGENNVLAGAVLLAQRNAQANASCNPKE